MDLDAFQLKESIKGKPTNAHVLEENIDFSVLIGYHNAFLRNHYN